MDTNSLIIALPLATFGITLAYILFGDRFVRSSSGVDSASVAGAGVVTSQSYARRATESRGATQRSVAGTANAAVGKAA